MDYSNDKEIRDMIIDIMKTKNMSYRDLALKMGTTKQNLYKKFNYTSLKLDELAEVCDALGYKLSIEITKNKIEDNSNSQTLDKISDIMKKLNEQALEEIQKYINE